MINSIKNKVIFLSPINEEIQNFKTGEKCLLVSTENAIKFSRIDIEKIIDICNQKPVYEMLFRNKLEGKAYGEEQAKNFLSWIVGGWREQKFFVFFVRSSEGNIIGAVDIKSNDLSRAEIGYWADENHAGIMSNAVTKLIEIARNAGYKILFATARLDNKRSQNVLLRNNFLVVGEIEKPNVGKRLLFEFKL